jgi:MOSC domain-containing protein YiiM
MQGKVLAVCISDEKSTPKENRDKGFLQANFGLPGDAHAGSEKQVSLLAQEDVAKFQKDTNIDAPSGSFAENIRTQGIDLVTLPLGTEVRVGEAVIEVTQKGKEPNVAHTYSYKGHSLLPTRGVFAKVIQSGNVKIGDRVLVIK